MNGASVLRLGGGQVLLQLFIDEDTARRILDRLQADGWKVETPPRPPFTRAAQRGRPVAIDAPADP